MPQAAAAEEDQEAQTTSPRWQRWGALTLVAACSGIAAYAYSRQGFALDPLVLRDRIAELGWLAPLAFVLFAALRIFFVLPSFVVMSVGGLLFGTLGGMLWGSLGFTLGGLIAFAIARGLGRDAVARRLKGRAQRVDDLVARRGAPWIALYTALPITPLTPVHASAGLTGLSPLAFTAAVVAGVVPRSAVLSFFGDAIAAGDGGRIALAVLIIAIAGAAGSAWVRRLARSEIRGDGAKPTETSSPKAPSSS